MRKEMLHMWSVMPIIVLAQFLCTSLWFAGNAVMSDLARALQLQPDFLAHLTSAVQFGFIIDTLLFAFFLLKITFLPSGAGLRPAASRYLYASHKQHLTE